FLPGDTGTILQVVRNPGWLLPYIACTMVALGLLVYFGAKLVEFLAKILAVKPGLPSIQKPSPVAWAVPGVVVGAAGLWLVVTMMAPNYDRDRFHFQEA